jgi:hypothetical protein
MALCATYDSNGIVSVVTPPPADVSTCALLIPTTGDSVNNPFMLSAADGALIASAVISAWAVGFACRALIRSLH